MRKILEERDADVGAYCGEHGRSTVDIKCPFCSTVTTAYVWSIRGGGKMCNGHNCDTMLTGTGKAQKLFPKLTEAQLEVLKDVHQFVCADIGDGWYPNRRVLKGLEKKGYIAYGKFPPNKPPRELGYFTTELGKAYLNS